MEKERLVIVDDEELIRNLLNLTLSNSDYNVIYTGDSKGAVKLLDIYDDVVDLLITDVRMKGIDGMALYNAYRAKYSDIKVVFITGNSDFDGIKIIEQDVNAMIVEKPFSQAELVILVHGFLDG